MCPVNWFTDDFFCWPDTFSTSGYVGKKTGVREIFSFPACCLWFAKKAQESELWIFHLGYNSFFPSFEWARNIIIIAMSGVSKFLYVDQKEKGLCVMLQKKQEDSTFMLSLSMFRPEVGEHYSLPACQYIKNLLCLIFILAYIITSLNALEFWNAHHHIWDQNCKAYSLTKLVRHCMMGCALYWKCTLFDWIVDSLYIGEQISFELICMRHCMRGFRSVLEKISMCINC